jgi:uncharacterized protein
VSPADHLTRARDELPVIRLLRGEGHTAQAVSRSYYAAFYAATAARLVVGDPRGRHAGVVAAFGRYVVNDGGLDPHAGRCLRRLFQLRTDADYSVTPVEPEAADQAARDATYVVEAVGRWIADRAD